MLEFLAHSVFTMDERRHSKLSTEIEHGTLIRIM